MQENYPKILNNAERGTFKNEKIKQISTIFIKSRGKLKHFHSQKHLETK